MLESIPKSVALRSTSADQARIDCLRKWQKQIFWIAIIYMITLVSLCFLAISTTIEAEDKAKQAAELIDRTRDVATFGNYMKELNPKTWEKYNNDQAFREKVHKVFGVKLPQELVSD